jgi:hypothetical protein
MADWETTKSWMGGFITAAIIAIIVLGILQLTDISSPFRQCQSQFCTVSDSCLLSVNWYKYPGTMWPNNLLTRRQKDDETDTLQKAQAWVLTQSKLPTFMSDAPMCTPIILVYPKNSSTEFWYGHTAVLGTLDVNPELDTYVFASMPPRLQIR